jgi:hypothetical protein
MDGLWVMHLLSAASRNNLPAGTAAVRGDVYDARDGGKAADVQPHAETRYDPDEDPDTEPATTPDEVEHDLERDQAEGDEEQVDGEPRAG